MSESDDPDDDEGLWAPAFFLVEVEHDGVGFELERPLFRPFEEFVESLPIARLVMLDSKDTPKLARDLLSVRSPPMEPVSRWNPGREGLDSPGPTRHLRL